LANGAVPVPTGMVDKRALPALATVDDSAERRSPTGNDVIQDFEFRIARRKNGNVIFNVIGKDLMYNA